MGRRHVEGVVYDRGTDRQWEQPFDLVLERVGECLQNDRQHEQHADVGADRPYGVPDDDGDAKRASSPSAHR